MSLHSLETVLSIPVPPGRAFAAALVPPGADQPFDIALHDQLENGFGDASQEVALIVLCQKFR